MTDSQPPPPAWYGAAARTCIRFAAATGVFGLIVGIAFQESVRKMDFTQVAPGLHIEARIHLALVHGHVFVVLVLLPLALAGALYLARRAGGAPLSRRAVRCLTRGVLPFAAATTALMLYKGYHLLLGVRWGATDLAAVDAALYGGLRVLRYVVYGAIHGGFGLSLGLFLLALWRSLGRAARAADGGRPGGP